MAPEVELRPPRREEADAVAALLNAHSRALHGTNAVTAEEIEHWFEIPTYDPEQDFRLAHAPDGTLLGYADVNDGGPNRRRYWIDLRLSPQVDADVGDALVAALERRAAETAAPGALIRGYLAAADEAARRVYERRGYVLIRHSLRMEIALDEEPEAPRWPDAVAVRTARADELERLHAVTADAFQDHWEFEPSPFEEFAHMVRGPDHDPELWFVAEEGEEVAGVCLCRPHDAGEPDVGWVEMLGVRRPWRRRGLGLALLRHSFRAFYDRGLRRVGLGVDAENLTGAVRLYERAGMSISRRNDIYERRL